VAITSGNLIGVLLKYVLGIPVQYTILAVIGGFMIHLLLDEIYSVDLVRMRLKKSFGTAFKFKSDNTIHTWLAYAITALTTWMVYSFTNVFEG
jgi:hypothetical protein